MLVSSAYPQACRTQHFFDREAVAGRSAGSGHDRPPLFDRINQFKTDADGDEFVSGTQQLLMRVARARAAKRPSPSVPGHPTSGFASDPPVPLARPSADHFSMALDYVQRALRVDRQLNAVYVT